jgi:hypothetical protein
MIVDYTPDPRNPSGSGMLYREVPDGEVFVHYADPHDPARRRALISIATSLHDVHPNSAKPYDRRLAVELATGRHLWLEPEVPVVAVAFLARPA